MLSKPYGHTACWQKQCYLYTGLTRLCRTVVKLGKVRKCWSYFSIQNRLQAFFSVCFRSCFVKRYSCANSWTKVKQEKEGQGEAPRGLLFSPPPVSLSRFTSVPLFWRWLDARGPRRGHLSKKICRGRSGYWASKALYGPSCPKEGSLFTGKITVRSRFTCQGRPGFLGIRYTGAF